MGPPIVLLHGLLGSSDNWHSVATMLADDYRVIVPDLRNHGRSPHSDTFNYCVLAEDIRRLIEEMALVKPVLVGHSMGGKAAMELALSCPDVAESLIVEDMIPGETQPISGSLIQTMLEMDLRSITRRKDAEELLLREVPQRAVVLFLLKNLGRDSDATYHWKPNLPALDKNYHLLWKALETGRVWKGPTLFVRGGKSDIVVAGHLERVFGYFPKARIATISQAGHWVHGEALTEFLIHVRQFLKTTAH